MQQILAYPPPEAVINASPRKPKDVSEHGHHTRQTASCAGTGHCTADTAIRGNNCQTEGTIASTAMAAMLPLITSALNTIDLFP